MLEVERWANDRNPLLAANAILYASLLGPITLVFQQLKQRTIFKYRLQPPVLTSWLALYHSDRSILETVIPVISLAYAGKDTPPNFSDNMMFVIRSMTGTINKNSPKSIDISNPNMQSQLFQDMLTTTVNGLKPNSLNSEIEQSANDSMKNYFIANELELGFFTLVIFPCLMIYQTFPRFIYRKAINGDTDALEKLLRLDSRLLYDPAIAEKLDNINTRKFSTFEKLVKSSVEPTKPKITRKRLLYSLAGFISATAHLMDQPLTETDIRDLFNAYSKDISGEDDADIPLASEVFYQAIRRARKNWLTLFDELKPDKNI